MLVLRLSALLGFVCSVVVSSACDKCPFRILERVEVTGFIDCCGAFGRHDVTAPAGTIRQIDLANWRRPTDAGRVDLWLVPADCEQLFDGAYPGGAPRCQVLIGPIAPDAVSSRSKLAAGRYRVFVQAHSSNVERMEYVGDVGIWGMDCVPGPLLRP